MTTRYPITATFIDEITYDIPSSNWTNDQWAKDLDNMKEVGMDTLVLMRGVFYDKCIYPSKIFPTLKKENECVSDQAFSSNLQKTSETEEHVKQHEGMQSQISDCGKL